MSSDTIMKWLPLSTSRGCLFQSQVKCFTNEAPKLISHTYKHLKPPMPLLGGNSVYPLQQANLSLVASSASI